MGGCWDTDGRLVAWSLGEKLTGIARPARPASAARVPPPQHLLPLQPHLWDGLALRSLVG